MVEDFQLKLTTTGFEDVRVKLVNCWLCGKTCLCLKVAGPCALAQAWIVSSNLFIHVHHQSSTCILLSVNQPLLNSLSDFCSPSIYINIWDTSERQKVDSLRHLFGYVAGSSDAIHMVTNGVKSQRKSSTASLALSSHVCSKQLSQGATMNGGVFRPLCTKDSTSSCCDRTRIGTIYSKASYVLRSFTFFIGIWIDLNVVLHHLSTSCYWTWNVYKLAKLTIWTTGSSLLARSWQQIPETTLHLHLNLHLIWMKCQQRLPHNQHESRLSVALQQWKGFTLAGGLNVADLV